MVDNELKRKNNPLEVIGASIFWAIIIIILGVLKFFY
jgi:hypothetical protein